MSLRPSYVPIAAIGALVALPSVLLKPFMEPPDWLIFLQGFLALFVILYNLPSWSNADARERDWKIYEEYKNFYLRYPWHLIATISFVAYGAFIVLNKDWIDLTAAQAFSIGLTIWFIPFIIGDLFFRGRRSPSENDEQAVSAINKGLIISLIAVCFIGIFVTSRAFLSILPIYREFRDGVAGSKLSQNSDALWAVWQFFFTLAALPVLACGLLGLAYYCFRKLRCV